MPELPDLHVFSGNLNKRLAGKVLKEVIAVNDKKLKTSVAELKSNLEGEVLDKVERVGKELHFYFKNGNVLGLHLMLNGDLFFSGKAGQQKNIIIELVFKEGDVLTLTDFQGMATPTLNPEERDAPDALSKEVNFDFLKAKLQKKTNIKKLLLDQHVIRGIGNAYADEILWDARISPLSVCSKIPDEKIEALLKSIKKVLENAIKQILKTHPDIIKGEIRDFLNIHNAKKTQSPTGGEIKSEMLNSRKTYYTNEQEMFE